MSTDLATILDPVHAKLFHAPFEAKIPDSFVIPANQSVIIGETKTLYTGDGKTTWLNRASLASSGGSSNITYPSGTPATTVPRPVLRDVRDDNADITGTNDATAQVQASIDYVATSNGGIVYIPGSVKVHQLILKQKVKLQGVGSSFGSAGVAPSNIIGTPGEDCIILGVPEDNYSEVLGLEDINIGNCARTIVSTHGVTNLTIRNVQLGFTVAGIYSNSAMERSLIERVEMVGFNTGIGFKMDDNGTVTNYIDKTQFKSIRATNTVNAFNVSAFRACNINTFDDLIVNGSTQSPMVFAAAMNNTKFDGYSSEVNGTSGPPRAFTTGSISSGSPSLTVASTTNLATSQQLTVTGAGTSGNDLVATISNIVGSVVTLSVNAATTVSGVDVTNAIFDDFIFNGSSAGGLSLPVVFVNCFPGPGGTSDRLRYALTGDGIYPTFVGSKWVRPINDKLLRGTFISSIGPVNQPTTLSSTSFAYSTLSVNAGKKNVYPGIPGTGTVLSLRGNAGNENSGTYGTVDVVKTNPNRDRVFSFNGDSGEIVFGNLVNNNQAIYVESGQLKYRGSTGTVTTIASA